MSSRMPTTSHDVLPRVDPPADRRTVEEAAARERPRDERLAAAGLAVAERAAFDDPQAQRLNQVGADGMQSGKRRTRPRRDRTAVG